MASISIKDVRKSYGKDEVVHGVNLEIANGEFVVILGPSGCVGFGDRASDPWQMGQGVFARKPRCPHGMPWRLARERTAPQRDPHSPGFAPDQKTVRGTVFPAHAGRCQNKRRRSSRPKKA